MGDPYAEFGGAVEGNSASTDPYAEFGGQMEAMPNAGLAPAAGKPPKTLDSGEGPIAQGLTTFERKFADMGPVIKYNLNHPRDWKDLAADKTPLLQKLKAANPIETNEGSLPMNAGATAANVLPWLVDPAGGGIGESAAGQLSKVIQPGRVMRTGVGVAAEAAKDIPGVRAVLKTKAIWDKTAPKPVGTPTDVAPVIPPEQVGPLGNPAQAKPSPPYVKSPVAEADMKPLASSNIFKAGYAPNSKSLVIEFRSGNVHKYTGVPQGLADQFFGADSHGSFFANRIKGNFENTRLGSTIGKKK